MDDDFLVLGDISTPEGAIEFLRLYQYGIPGEMPPHSFDLNDKTVEIIIAALDAPKKTNGDRIRAMSDEDLAKKISGLESFALTCGSGCSAAKWLEWLRQEASK